MRQNEMRMVDGKWIEPRTAPFSGKYMEWDLNLSPDGSYLIFHSRMDGGYGRMISISVFARRTAPGPSR